MKSKSGIHFKQELVEAFEKMLIEDGLFLDSKIITG
jgi:hypothetical protein